MNISLYTLGCKLNQAETDELKQSLLDEGFFVVPYDTDEQITIVRACGVTCGASQRTRQMIRRAKRKGIYVIATGCLEDKDLPEIDMLAKTNKAIMEHLRKSFIIEKSDPNNACDTSEEKNRKMIKIQTGCAFRCTYCIIPTFRGNPKSDSPTSIIKKIKNAEKQGFHEVILTGINVCLYKYRKTDFINLIKKILKETTIERIRFGSLDPRLITDEFIALFKDERLMPQMHLSLQSGSNAVLKRMFRNYTRADYKKIVNKCRKINPTFSFTTDIIVGFPGETNKEFDESVKFVKQIKFAKVHVFPYSSRPGTVASDLPNHVQDRLKKQRTKRLIEVSNQVGKRFAKSLIGKKREVLIEGKRNGYWEGYTPEFVRVFVRTDENLRNKILNIKVESKYIK